ncbi:MAG: C-type lectin domain-containing protein [Planctomycetota bacterium]
MNPTRHAPLLIASLLSFSPFAHTQGADECANAQLISGPGPHAFDLTSATPSTFQLGCNITTTPNRADVWFRWTPTQDVRVAVDVCGQSNVDLLAIVGVGGQCNSGLTEIACAYSSCDFSARFLARAGQEYRIRIGARRVGEVGSGTFTLVESVPVFNPNNGSHYEVVHESTSWFSARDRARLMAWDSRGGALASLTTAAELAWVQQNLPIDRTWVGAYQDLSSPGYAEPNGGWVWLDGTPANLAWAPGQPDDAGISSHYAELLGSGLFADTPRNSAEVTSFLVEWTPGLGDSYCDSNPNSTGATGAMSLEGSAVVFENDMTLVASSLPPGAFGFFLVSPGRGFIANPAGSAGNLCLSMSIGRFVGPGQIQQVSPSGSFSLPISLFAIPSPGGPNVSEPGDELHFQAWFRDASGGVATSNFTDGLAVTLL